MTTRQEITTRLRWRDVVWNSLERPLDVWSDHPMVDMMVGGIVVGTHALVVYTWHAGNVLNWANQAQRLALYAAGAGMMALIAGFAGTAIAQYGSSSGPVVGALRGRHGGAIRRNWLSITKWLLVTTVLCIVAMAIDSTKSPRGSEWVFEAALSLAVVKFVRLVFLFGLILSSIDSGANQGSLDRGRAVLTPIRRQG